LLIGCTPAEPISSSDLQEHIKNYFGEKHQLFFAPLPYLKQFKGKTPKQ